MKFYTTHCPKCNVLKSKLDAKHLVYETIDDVDYQVSIGIRQSPMLEVDGELLDFASAVKYINALEATV